MPAEDKCRAVDRRGPGSAIAKQLVALVQGAARVQAQGERPWASMTFSGTRYSFEIRWPTTTEPSARQKFAQILPDHEFLIPGYFVADAVITDQSQSHVRIEILSIADPLDARSVFALQR